MKRIFVVMMLASMTFLFGSCATAPTITWTPKGGETAILNLRSASDANFLAIRSIDDQFQANPWTFYVPSKQAGVAPKQLGEGQDANVVVIDASTDYELELGFYRKRGLLQQDQPEWHDSKPMITLKALEPKGKYDLTLFGPSFSLGSGKQIFGTLKLRKGFKNVQEWELYGDADNIEILEVKPSLF